MDAKASGPGWIHEQMKSIVIGLSQTSAPKFARTRPNVAASLATWSRPRKKHQMSTFVDKRHKDMAALFENDQDSVAVIKKKIFKSDPTAAVAFNSVSIGVPWHPVSIGLMHGVGFVRWSHHWLSDHPIAYASIWTRRRLNKTHSVDNYYLSCSSRPCTIFSSSAASPCLTK